MVRGIGTVILALALLTAGCRDASKTADRQPAGSAQAADPAASPPPARMAAAAPAMEALSAPVSEAVSATVAESASATWPNGKYVVEIPAADASLQRISLVLRPDSTCVFKTENVGKGQHVESGLWNRDGAMVRIVIGPPREPSKQSRFAFAASGDSLISVEWDTTRFGAEGLGTLVRR